jgi:hypothetical protein
MVTRLKPKTADLTFEQIEMLPNFSDSAAGYPEMSFEEIAKKLGVDFSKA